MCSSCNTNFTRRVIPVLSQNRTTTPVSDELLCTTESVTERLVPTLELSTKHFTDAAHIVDMTDPASRARINKIAPAQIEQLLRLYPSKEIHVGVTHFVEGQKGRPSTHTKKKGVLHMNWIVLFRARGRHGHKSGRNNTPEALVRAAVQASLGRDTHPSGRHDGTGSYEFAAHSDLFEMMSSDVNAPLVLKALRNFEAGPSP